MALPVRTDQYTKQNTEKQHLERKRRADLSSAVLTESERENIDTIQNTPDSPAAKGNVSPIGL